MRVHHMTPPQKEKSQTKIYKILILFEKNIFKFGRTIKTLLTSKSYMVEQKNTHTF